MGKKTKKYYEFVKQLKSQKTLLFMSIPFVLWCILFAYIPIWGWLMAFVKYIPGKPILSADWIGLKYFKLLFSKQDFWISIRNTLAISGINLVLGFSSAIVLAIMLNEVKNEIFKRTIQTISYLPHFISWVVAANIIMSMLASEGPLNKLLLSLNIVPEPILLLSKSNLFWLLMGITNIWKSVGWNSIIYLATICMISPSLYESADIDGANRFQKIIYITIPGILPTFVILLILNIGWILSTGFEQPYLLQNNLVKDVSETIDIYVLQKGVAMGQFSYGTAAGIFKSIVSLILVFSANRISGKLTNRKLM